MNKLLVGIDVDLALMDEGGKLKSRVFDNDVAGHAALLGWLRDRGASLEHTHLCLEATGP